MRTHVVPRDARVLDLETRQRCEIGVRRRIEACRDEIDQLDAPALTRARLEELVLTCAHRALRHQPLDDLESLVDLPLVRRRAVSPDEELTDVGRYRILPLEAECKILANHEAGECL